VTGQINRKSPIPQELSLPILTCLLPLAAGSRPLDRLRHLTGQGQPGTWARIASGMSSLPGQRYSPGTELPQAPGEHTLAGDDPGIPRAPCLPIRQPVVARAVRPGRWVSDRPEEEPKIHACDT